METKICIECEKEKSIEAFQKTKNNASRFKKCRACMRFDRGASASNSKEFQEQLAYNNRIKTLSNHFYNFVKGIKNEQSATTTA